MITRPSQDAIARAGACLAEGIAISDSLPVAEAARLAYTPTGPSLEELEQRIAARRGHQTPTPAACPPAPRRGRVSNRKSA